MARVMGSAILIFRGITMAFSNVANRFFEIVRIEFMS
jgi:hypothetical protein